MSDGSNGRHVSIAAVIRDASTGYRPTLRCAETRTIGTDDDIRM
jgi:hypothetical protein